MKENHLKGVIYIICSSLLYVALAGVEKGLVGRRSALETTFLRYFSALVAFLIYWLIIGRPSLKTNSFKYHFLRATVAILAMFFFLWGLKSLPLSTDYLLRQTTTIFLPLVALVWLKEKLPKWCLLSLSLGLIGAVFIIKPGTDFFQASALIVLGGAFLAAIAQVCTRLIVQRTSVLSAVFYMNLISTLLLSPAGFSLKWSYFGGTDWLLIGSMGMFALFAQLTLGKAYQYAPVAKNAPWSYLGIPLTVLFDWVIWQKLPDIYSGVGALFIIAGGILILKESRPAEKALKYIEE